MEANRPSKQDADQEGAMFLLLASLLLLLAFEYAGTSHPEQTSFCNNSSGFSYLSWRQIFFGDNFVLETSRPLQPKHQ